MGRLELRRSDAGIMVYTLEEEPVHPGRDVQLLLEGGVWITGRFEWTGERESPPRLHVTCGGPWEAMSMEGDTLPIPSEIKFDVPRDALLRWPERGEGDESD